MSNQLQAQPGYPIQDEIDLIDLWLSIIRHKLIFVVSFVIVLATGVLYSFLHVPSYQYSVTLQLGGMRGAGKFNLVETPDTLKSTIDSAYIPQVLDAYRQAYPQDSTRYKVESTVPAKGDIVVIDINGKQKRVASINNILNAIVEKVVKNENQLLHERVNDLRNLLQEQISKLQVQISQLRKSRETLGNTGSNTDKAMTVLLLDNQIAHYNERLDNLQQQLKVGLTSDIRYTQPVTSIVRSPEPVGLWGTALLALSGIMGISVGLMAVFIVAFLSAARERRAHPVAH